MPTRPPSSSSSIVTRIKDSSQAISSAASEIATGNSDLSRRTEAAGSEPGRRPPPRWRNSPPRAPERRARPPGHQLGHWRTQRCLAGAGECGRPVVTTMSASQISSRRSPRSFGHRRHRLPDQHSGAHAAVEAARAGEQGRVSRSSPPNCAHPGPAFGRCRQEIKGLIDDSVSKVNDGSAWCRKLAPPWRDRRLGAAQSRTDIMAEISAASQEQSPVSNRSTRPLLQMDETTHQNAALVGRSHRRCPRWKSRPATSPMPCPFSSWTSMRWRLHTVVLPPHRAPPAHRSPPPGPRPPRARRHRTGRRRLAGNLISDAQPLSHKGPGASAPGLFHAQLPT